MTAIVQRDDLSQRKALSKSTLTGFDICGTKSWFDIHYRLPLIPDEKITFGSAVDAAVEAAIKYLRMGHPINEDNCLDAAREVIERDGVDVSLDEVAKALILFVSQVAPHYDFALARLQEHIVGELPDLGEVDGHPDVWLADGRIFDVKTSKRAKFDERTVELGFYALTGAEYSGAPVPAAGYWTYVRTTRPYWQILEFPVTDEWLRWTVEKAAAYVRAKRADEVLNKSAKAPINWSFTGGPKYGSSSCGSCQYQPMCSIAIRGESDDAAA
jgi:hypothetical protein